MGQMVAAAAALVVGEAAAGMGDEWEVGQFAGGA